MAIFERGVSDPCRQVAAWADDLDLRHVEGHGDLEDSTLLNLRHPVRSTGALARLRVTLGNVQALDHDGSAARVRSTPERDPQCRCARGSPDDLLDLAALAGVRAGKDDDGVATPDLGYPGRVAVNVFPDHHSTSGASETIFM